MSVCTFDIIWLSLKQAQQHNVVEFVFFFLLLYVTDLFGFLTKRKEIYSMPGVQLH